MMKVKQSNQGNKFMLLGFVVLVAFILLIISQSKLSMNSQNGGTPSPAYQATSGNSNSDLDQDMNTINSSLNNTNNSTTDVNSGINDTPIAQPQ